MSRENFFLDVQSFFKKKNKFKLALAAWFSFGLMICSANVLAESSREDYDLDDDGLIEINDLNDLDQIRYSLDGRSLYGSSAGCPVNDDPKKESGCFGFELTQDLDFDTNQDGQLNHDDQFWNEGQGWVPIENPGSGNLGFRAVFEGNGFAIKNLYMHGTLDNGYRSNLSRQAFLGLFHYLHNATVRNLAFIGTLSSVQNPHRTAGVLAGKSWGAEINHVFSSVSVSAGTASGLVGKSTGSLFKNIFVSGSLNGSNQTYGVSETTTSRGTTIENTLVVGWFSGSNAKAALGSSNAAIINSYWAQELTTIDDAPASLIELMCTASDGEQPCTEGVYESWPLNSEVGSYWDLGTAQQLPALVINERLYRDSDGDGRIDSFDNVPFHHAVYADGDEDGAVDIWNPNCDETCRKNSGLLTDQLPSSAAAYLDADLDGLPEAWADSCDEICQSESGLELDAYPLDQDNDGDPDTSDNDDNGDDVADIDSDSNGLIEIRSLAQLNAIRYQLDGKGMRLTNGGELHSSGCPITFMDGHYQRACHGFELMTNLDFDTNQDGVISDQDEYWNQGKGWLPIGYVTDEYKQPVLNLQFDGKRKTIKNLYINRPTKAYSGLFSFVDGGRITQLNLNGHLTSVTGGRYTGLMVGKMQDGLIARLTVNGRVQSVHSDIGGLVGSIYGVYVRSVGVIADVSGANSVGGLVGQSEGAGNHLSESHFKGSVRGGLGIGGLMGYGRSLIDFCSSDAQVYGQSSVGGLMGYAAGSNEPLINGTNITNTVVEGKVVGNKKLGGIIGENFYDSIINGVVTAVDVEVDADPSDSEWGSQIGGAVGFNHSGKISNVYVLGNVMGRHEVGGLIGKTVHRDNVIRNALVLGKITVLNEPNTTFGGIMGSPEFSGVIESIYWAKDRSGLNNSGLNADVYGNEYGLTLAQLSCPIASDNINCAPITLYESWPSNENQIMHWRFGDHQQLPKLVFGQVYADSDLDGHLDHKDDFPFDNSMYVDMDGDGYPDQWSKNCDAQCQTASGKHLDNLPDHPQASLDTDHDGRPEVFHESCNVECRLTSGLVLDEYPNDRDNDGLVDADDPDNNADNGRPIVAFNKTAFDISVDNDVGTKGTLIFDQGFFESVSVTDVVDPAPTFYLVGIEGEEKPQMLQVTDGERIELDAGTHTVYWAAEDDSQNRSGLASTIVNVYPRIQFSQPSKTVAERTDITVNITTTAPMPAEQVSVLVSVVPDQTTLQSSDFTEQGFALDGRDPIPVEIKHIEKAQSESEWIGHLSVPLLQDGVGEPNEQLALVLRGVAEDSPGAGVIEFVQDAQSHLLTIDDGNWPPLVSLTLSQGGIQTNEIWQDQGEVIVTATAMDPEGDQIANVVWQSQDAALTHKLDQETRWQFDPTILSLGTHWLRFTAEDHHDVPQGGTTEVTFTVKDSLEKPTEKPTHPVAQQPSGNTRSSGAGSITFGMLIALLIVSRRRLGCMRS